MEGLGFRLFWRDGRKYENSIDQKIKISVLVQGLYRGNVGVIGVI